MKPGFGNIEMVFRKAGGLPEPDALFDTRTGLSITDSIGAQSITIGSFPMCYWKTTTNWTCRYAIDDSSQASPTDWTFIVLIKKRVSTDTDNRLWIESMCKTTNNLTQGVFLASDYGCYLTGNYPAINYTYGLSPPDYTKWMAIGFNYTASTDIIRAIINGVIGAAQTNTGGANSLVKIGCTVNNDDLYVRGFFEFNKVLSNAEITNIRNGIYPTDGSMIMCIPFLSVDDLTYFEQIDGVAGLRGYNAGGYIRGWSNNGSNLKPPLTPWVDRDNELTGTYNLYYGYTRQGTNVISYLPTGLKGEHSHIDDIECPSSGCIHNMAESRIDFSGITDATIKAIFDKSNRTYWMSSIESTTHYIDAGAGYYGLWHPTELLSDFIDTHAQLGHKGHILASLRTSEGMVTGITALRVFKTSLT